MQRLLTVSAFALFVLAAVWGIARDMKSLAEGRRTWRKEYGLCPACGYDLTGNVSGTCPECGGKVG
ncbi:MAG: hypothetical protein JWM97_2371 [Phycisphaerales bacterium]|nr:hypothetical protein [Phycisphaerales bacterium]